MLHAASAFGAFLAIVLLNSSAAAQAPDPAAAPASVAAKPADTAVDPDAERLRQSVIKFKCKLEPRSAARPWKLDPVQEVGGSGVVIAPGRVLTNAHVVHEATEVLVETDRTSLPVPAKVLSLDLGRDLALVEVDDAEFNAGHPPVGVMPGLPKDGIRVTVMGYPMGGESLSTTSGVVSRSEWAGLGRRGEPGMRVQVDAAVNFGNSGGPAFVEGKLAGLVFSGMNKAMADNISYLIATEEIARFLKETEAGAVTGNCVMHATTQTLENPALRSKLGVSAGTSGVVVIEHKDGPLQAWDIITKVNGMAVDNKGQVTVEDGRKVDMACAVGRFDPAKDGNTVQVEVIRGGKPMTLELPAEGARDGVIRARPNGDYPYLVCGPLAFGPMHQDLVRDLGAGGMRMIYFGGGPTLQYLTDNRPAKGKELVAVLCPLMSSATARGYDATPGQTVRSVNGKACANFAEFVDLMRDAEGEWLVLEFNEEGADRLVFRRQELMDASEPVMDANGIRQQASKDIRERWNREKP